MSLEQKDKVVFKFTLATDKRGAGNGEVRKFQNRGIVRKEKVFESSCVSKMPTGSGLFQVSTYIQEGEEWIVSFGLLAVS